MSPRHAGRSREQKHKRNTLQTAKDHEIFAVRRRISPDSYSVFEDIATRLEPEVVNAGRIFEPASLGVTVVGFTRFDKRHRHKGISTPRAIERVPSASKSLRARLGGLGVFGSGNKHKLSFVLECGELGYEIDSFERVFRLSGFPLKRDPNNPEGIVTPHCSIALLHEDHVAHFGDEKTLHRLTGICLEEACGDTSIMLEPIPKTTD
jgi:hypothetical protein